MVFFDDNPPAFETEVLRKAHLTHRCRECQLIIPVVAHYWIISWASFCPLFNKRVAQSVKLCQSCKSDWETVAVVQGTQFEGVIYGEIMEEIREALYSRKLTSSDDLVVRWLENPPQRRPTLEDGQPQFEFEAA